jgi:DNA (cytosine-5)-methyltransferase 1
MSSHSISKTTFIDLFAGIGGIRIGFEAHGCECVFSSEWDKYAQKTYSAFFGEVPAGDITKINPADIPNHDILTGGFPCQPFSLAGVSKKNSLGRVHGFADPTQGTLFFNVKEILRAKQPKAFLLENVKNLLSHDKGNTFRIIRESIDEVGYDLFFQVICSSGWVPQHRERIFLVGFRKDLKVANFCFPEVPAQRIMELDDLIEPKVDPKYTLGAGTWATLVRHKAHHAKAGNGFGYGLLKKPLRGTVTRTMSARYHKDGAEILVDQGNTKNPRRLTPLECMRLQGFPKHLEPLYDGTKTQPVSDTQAYRQFGNSVTMPVVKAISAEIIAKLNSLSVPKFQRSGATVAYAKLSGHTSNITDAN